MSLSEVDINLHHAEDLRPAVSVSDQKATLKSHHSSLADCLKSHEPHGLVQSGIILWHLLYVFINFWSFFPNIFSETCFLRIHLWG